MRVRGAHAGVFASNAVELNNRKIIIKTDERLVSSVTGAPAVEEADTIMIQIGIVKCHSFTDSRAARPSETSLKFLPSRDSKFRCVVPSKRSCIVTSSPGIVMYVGVPDLVPEVGRNVSLFFSQMGSKRLI